MTERQESLEFDDSVPGEVESTEDHGHAGDLDEVLREESIQLGLGHDDLMLAPPAP